MDLASLESITISDIEQHKQLSDDELRNDIARLRAYPADEHRNTFVGNRFLYHFQFKNLLLCRRQGQPTIYEIWADPVLRHKLLTSTVKRARQGASQSGNVFECFRINLGSVVMFKAATAKYLYKKYHATKVLDPTAGWGGRMLAAHSLGIEYTGIDTNIDLKPAYDSMIEFLADDKLAMIWDHCLDIDFGQLDYDFVLTSPPYVNLESYQHMTPWTNDKIYYQEFLIPLWENCLAHIRPGGHVALNISPKMYELALTFGLAPADIQEELLQQTGVRSRSDKIYIWTRRKYPS